MRKISISLALVAGLFVTQANADFTGRDASNAVITFKNPGACASVVCVPVAQLYDGTNVVTLTTAGANGESNTLTGVPVYGRNMVFNGTTWDRWTGAVTQSGTWNITNISGTISLPTGAATSALQTSAAAAKGEGATGAAVPSGAQYLGMNVGGNLTGAAGLSAGADAVTNSTAQFMSGSFNYFYNGTTWDRVRGSITNGILVQVSNTLASLANNADSVTPLSSNAGSPVIAYNYVFDGTNWNRQRPSSAVLNPCETVAQSYAPISITTATTTRIVAPSASNKTYICAIFLTSAAADNVGIVEGTGGTCGTGTAGVIGGTTAANGPNFAANGGMFLQAGGKVAVAQTAGTNVDLCLITSAATPLAGGIKYVQAP